MSNSMMQAMQLTGRNRMTMRTIPRPELFNDNDVMIKMTAVGVCGSDVHYYSNGRIGSQIVKYPFTVGHEGAGVIVRTGNAVTAVKVGDRVAIDPAMPCGVCDQCRCGRPHTCRKLTFLGCPDQAEGCLAEYLVMPQECCFKLTDGMSFERGALSEPLSIGLYAVKSAGDVRGKNIAILGSGPIGLSVMLAARARGANRIYMTDKLSQRLTLAHQGGADWIGNPDTVNIVKAIAEDEPLLLDVVFECCGEQDAVFQAVELLQPGGKLLLIGIPPTLDNWLMPVDTLRHKELTIQNVRRQNHCVQETLDLMDSGKINPDFMITHHFNFTETQAAFELVANYRDGVVKAMIHFSD